MKCLTMAIKSNIFGSITFMCLTSAMAIVSNAQAQCQLMKLQSSDLAYGDSFSRSVAIDGDRLIVGASGDDDNGSGSGSAYIFRHNGNAWVEEAKLLATDGQASDRFGFSVDISGDFAIVGAYHNDQGGSNAGAAYIFRYIVEIDEWVQHQKLLAPDSQANYQFGTSVAISDNHAIVGAPNGFVGHGAAYSFHFSDDKQLWLLNLILIASVGSIGDSFGKSVDIDGDHAIVGAPDASIDGLETGVAYVFEEGVNEHGLVWFEQSMLTASDGSGTDQFGTIVAISGDKLVIGAPWDTNQNGIQAGAAYVFHYDTNKQQWNEQAKLTPSDGNAYDRFGRVAIDGNEILVGSPHHDFPINQAGGAYVFQYSSQSKSWIELGKLKASGINSGDYYGLGVGVSNGIGIVSAPWHNDSFGSAGAAFVFDILANEDSNYNGIIDACEIGFADLNSDGVVDDSDVLILLGFWGSCPGVPFECLGDLNGDLSVNTSDLLILFGNWG